MDQNIEERGRAVTQLRERYDIEFALKQERLKVQQELSSLDVNSTWLLVLPQPDTMADERVKADLNALPLCVAANPALVRQRLVERHPTLLDWRRHFNTTSPDDEDNMDLTDKKPGDRGHNTANQLKKKCKKKFFQGIHDRFIRDETFRNRMIENGRDEDACRQMDVLANEDHTHHLTPQECYRHNNFKQDRFQYCASGAQTWFLTSIVHLAAIETKRRRSSQTSTKSTEFFFFFMVELARWSWWTPHSCESHHGDEPSTDGTG